MGIVQKLNGNCYKRFFVFIILVKDVHIDVIPLFVIPNRHFATYNMPVIHRIDAFFRWRKMNASLILHLHKLRVSDDDDGTF